MIIKPIKSLYGENGTRVTANKKRISMIKANIANESELHSKFVELSKYLESGNLDAVTGLITNDLFYEEVPSDFIMGLNKLYVSGRPRQREALLEQLEENYKIKAIKSAGYAWRNLIVKAQ